MHVVINLMYRKNWQDLTIRGKEVLGKKRVNTPMESGKKHANLMVHINGHQGACIREEEVRNNRAARGSDF